MIFLSHNYNDKPVVEQFAVALSEVFGKESIFYDSWSIAPGEGIIDKMNEGLGAADLFLFFVSSNSLQSKMVEMEWQNGLMKASQGKMRLVPIKLDAALIPPILMQTVYLDLYNQGLDITLRQVIELAKGEDTFTRQFANFSNLRGTVEKASPNSVIVCIEAVHFTEPRSEFVFLLPESTEEKDIAARVTSASQFQRLFHTGLKLDNGLTCNGQMLGVSSSLAPKFPFRALIEWRNGKEPDLQGALHHKTEEDWVSVPLMDK